MLMTVALTSQDHGEAGIMLAGLLAETACTVCLLLKRVYRTFPIFLSFVAFGSLVDALGFAIYLKGRPEDYWRMFLWVMALQCLFEIGVASEMLSRVFGGARQPRTDESGWRDFRMTWLAVAIGVSSISVAFLACRNISPWARTYLQVDLGVSVLRALIFTSVLCALLLYGVRWNSLVTQIAVSMSLFYCFDLVCEIMLEMEARSATSDQLFYRIEHVRTGAWCAVMIIISLYLVTRRKIIPPLARTESELRINETRTGMISGRHSAL